MRQSKLRAQWKYGTPQAVKNIFNIEGNLRFLSDEKKSSNLFPFPRLVWRDVNSGDLAMSIALTRSGTVTGAVLARAPASDTSDEMLVKRIAAGDKLAMQVLFARHRTPVYRWLLRFVGNETVAEDLLSECSSTCGSRPADLRAAPPSPHGCSRSRASRRSRPVVVGPMRRLMKPLRPLWPTAPTIRRSPCRRRAAASWCAGLDEALGRPSRGPRSRLLSREFG